MSKPLAYSKLKISVIYNTVLLKGVWLAKDGVETRMLETRVSKNYAEILVIWSGPGLLLVTYKSDLMFEKLCVKSQHQIFHIYLL